VSSVFEDLVGKFVSVLITGKGGKKETYLGRVEQVEGGYLFIRSIEDPSFHIEAFIIRCDVVESIWVLKSGEAARSWLKMKKLGSRGVAAHG